MTDDIKETLRSLRALGRRADVASRKLAAFGNTGGMNGQGTANGEPARFGHQRERIRYGGRAGVCGSACGNAKDAAMIPALAITAVIVALIAKTSPSSLASWCGGARGRA
jgi:hypothetical protein